MQTCYEHVGLKVLSGRARSKFAGGKIVTITWYSSDMFHCMLKAGFVALVSLKVPSGWRVCVCVCAADRDSEEQATQLVC